ncbi:MAG: DUF4870 domain-containing protein [Planctomycetales bacterium]|nr:DUF4870 domain-containing protein [Planctomycetales bacterium]
MSYETGKGNFGDAASGIVETNPDARQWAMFAHLAALSGYVGLPFGNIIGPLVVWLMKKDQYPFVDDQGKESLNFHISILIYGFVAGVLLCVYIGFVLLPAVILVDVIVTILAALAANKGETYRYPLTIRFLR